MRVARLDCRGGFAVCSRLRHFLVGAGVGSEGRHTQVLAPEVPNPRAASTATSRREQS